MSEKLQPDHLRASEGMWWMGMCGMGGEAWGLDQWADSLPPALNKAGGLAQYSLGQKLVVVAR